MVKMLIKSTCNEQERDKLLEAALLCAAQIDHIDIVEFVIEQNPIVVNKARTSENSTALVIAFAFGQLGIMKALI